MSLVAASETRSASETVIPNDDHIKSAGRGEPGPWCARRLRWSGDTRTEHRADEDDDGDREHPADHADQHRTRRAAIVERVTDADDKCAGIVKDALSQLKPGDNFIVIGAGELGKKSSLRALFEDAENAAAVPCYVDDARDIGRGGRHASAGHASRRSRTARFRPAS